MNLLCKGQGGVAVNRPGHNGTYISFNDMTVGGPPVLQYDCGWSPNVIYSGSTIIIYAPFAWAPGHRYYITFDSGWNLIRKFFIKYFLSFRSIKWK